MRRKTDKLVAACTAISLLCLLVTVVFVAPTVLRNRQVTERIQEERLQSVIRNCQDVNKRHDAMIAKLDAALEFRLRENRPSEAERERMLASTVMFTQILEASVPRRDCARLARQTVGNDP